MINCKSHFPINIIIELFVTLIRSTKETLTLLHPTPYSSSINPNCIPCSPAILYYGGISKWVGITNSPYGYGLYFRSDIVVTMSILHN